jgi:hypothetical protein
MYERTLSVCKVAIHIIAKDFLHVLLQYIDVLDMRVPTPIYILCCIL